MLTWGAPQKTNGKIVRYEVFYNANDEPTISNVGLSTTFTIPDLPLGSLISDISITAYTNKGQGEASNLPNMIVLGGEFCIHEHC